MIYLCLNLIGAETTMINYEVLRRKKVILRARAYSLGVAGVQRSNGPIGPPSNHPAVQHPASHALIHRLITHIRALVELSLVS